MRMAIRQDAFDAQMINFRLMWVVGGGKGLIAGS